MLCVSLLAGVCWLLTDVYSVSACVCACVWLCGRCVMRVVVFLVCWLLFVVCCLWLVVVVRC